MIALAGGVVQGEWITAGAATGVLGLVGGGTAIALLPITRRLLRAGYDRADIVHALSTDLARDRELKQFRYGDVSPKPVHAARLLAYGGLGVAGLGAASSLVPFIDPWIGLGAMAYGMVAALVGSTVGVVFAKRRLDRPGALWLRFWRSRAGEWAVQLAGRGLTPELTAGQPSAGQEPDASDVRRIREWVEDGT
jgi:hypothetical protein